MITTVKIMIATVQIILFTTVTLIMQRTDK